MQLVAKEHGCLGSSGGNTTGRFENPFVTIPSAYQTLDSFMRVNGLVHTESGVIPCYETNGESMDIYIGVSKTVWGSGLGNIIVFLRVIRYTRCIV